jgi:hypothetical protein
LTAYCRIVTSDVFGIRIIPLDNTKGCEIGSQYAGRLPALLQII